MDDADKDNVVGFISVILILVAVVLVAALLDVDDAENNDERFEKIELRLQELETRLNRDRM